MICPRCGNDIPNGCSRCDKCGLLFIDSSINSNISNTSINYNINKNTNENTNDNININVIDNNINNYSVNSINVSNISNSEENSNKPIDLNEYFIGNNYNKINNSFFSLWCLLFGIIYSLYRKMYLLSFIWIGIDVASIYVMGKYSIFVIVGLNIIMSFIFNYLYKFVVDNKVDNVKRKYWGHDINEIIYRCKMRGGTSSLSAFFFIFGCIVCFVAAVGIYFVSNHQFYKKNVQENINFYYRVPSMKPNNFEKISPNDSNSVIYEFSNNVNFCTIVVNISKDYESIDSYIDEIKNKYDDGSNSIKSEQVNILGQKWTYVSVETKNKEKYYYHMYFDKGYLYLYEYDIYNAFGKKCDKLYNNVKYSNKVG